MSPVWRSCLILLALLVPLALASLLLGVADLGAQVFALSRLPRTLAVLLTGAALVLACDILARLIRYPYEMPVGTVLGVLGSGLFLWLLHRGPTRG